MERLDLQDRQEQQVQQDLVGYLAHRAQQGGEYRGWMERMDMTPSSQVHAAMMAVQDLQERRVLLGWASQGVMGKMVKWAGLDPLAPPVRGEEDLVAWCS